MQSEPPHSTDCLWHSHFEISCAEKATKYFRASISSLCLRIESAAEEKVRSFSSRCEFLTNSVASSNQHRKRKGAMSHPWQNRKPGGAAGEGADPESSRSSAERGPQQPRQPEPAVGGQNQQGNPTQRTNPPPFRMARAPTAPNPTAQLPTMVSGCNYTPRAFGCPSRIVSDG